MKKIVYFSILMLTLSSCNFTTSTHDKPENKPENKPVKLVLTTSMLSDKKDHVCGMTLQEGQIADTTTYNSKVYGFCAASCKADFIKDPEAMLNK